MTAPSPRPVAPRIPPIIRILGGVGLLVIVGPVIALALRVSWGQVPQVLGEQATRDMLTVTLAAAAQATIITVALGVPLAVTLRGSRMARLLVMLPLAMPPVVGGLALTAAMGRRGFTAPLLDALGIQFAFAFPGVVLAHVFVCLPFVVVSVDSALRQIDHEVLASAAGVGMSPRAVLWRVTLPTVAPAIATGAGLAFARSLGEFGTTLTFAGSMPGVTRTMPLGIYLERELNQDRAYVLAVILIGVALLSLSAALSPTFLRRRRPSRPRSIGELDAARLRQLSAPTAGPARVQLRTAAGTTTFTAGTTTAIIGPNGSGKTTLTGLIAGRLRGPHVEVDCPGRIILLTQNPGLPPRSRVAAAITMATRSRAATEELLDAAGLTDLADVPIAHLSGGQAAQVALLRALGARPSVLILDEPLAAVDVDSAAAWRQLLRASTPDRTTLLVTHDPIELAALSQHTLVMEGGVVAAHLPTAQALQVPPTAFAARLAGVNRIAAPVTEVTGPTATLTCGDCRVVGMAADPSPQLRPGPGPGGQGVAVWQPVDTLLRLPGNHGTDSARNAWPGTVTAIDESAQVTVDIGETTIRVPITAQSVARLGLAEGSEVICVTKARAITIYPGPV